MRSRREKWPRRSDRFRGKSCAGWGAGLREDTCQPRTWNCELRTDERVAVGNFVPFAGIDVALATLLSSGLPTPSGLRRAHLTPTTHFPRIRPALRRSP